MSSASSARLLVVNQLHPEAQDTNPGSENLPLRTIQAAAKLAFAGDTILVHAGTYREEVAPPRGGDDGRPITYQAAPGEVVSIKGSDVYRGEWQACTPRGVYSAHIPLATGQYNPFATPLVMTLPTYAEQMGTAAPVHTLGQVFVDNEMLVEVDSREQLDELPGTWLAGKDGSCVLVHFPVDSRLPEDCTVELTLRKAVFRPAVRGLGYITLRGLRLEHAANAGITSFWEDNFPPQQGLVSCRSGHHWVLEGNQIRHAKSIGLDIGSEGRMKQLDGMLTPGYVGYHRIQSNIISDNGQCGICGLGHIGTQIIGNVLERNNNLGAAAWEEAAIKTHLFIRGLIESNLIRGNHCNGLWLDNVYQDIRVTRNVILANQGAGVFIEMGGGPCLIDNNVIGLQTMGNSGIGGNGIFAHDAGGITVAHNFLCQNANFGVCMQIATERNYMIYPGDTISFEQQPLGEKRCDCREERIQNNIFVGNHRGAVNLPYPAEKTGEMFCDHNLYGEDKTESLYAINTTAGAIPEEISAALDLSAPRSYLVLGDQFLVTPQAWREAMGMDLQSAVGVMNNISWQMLHPGHGPWLTFQVQMDGGLTCPKISEIDGDFFGNKMSGENPLPGPFQNTDLNGPNHFRLWPLKGGSCFE